MTLVPGQVVGSYQILGGLGAGAMGEIYRARDTRLEREVALKVLPDEMARDAERLARFEREAKILAALRHPGIVTVYSVENVDGLHFLTMELVEGQTLFDVIERGGVDLPRFYSLATAIADALRAAHDRGVTHRDIKPENIVVDESWRPTILDFGIARIEPRGDREGRSSQQLTVPGVVMGTVPYMSPEALRGGRVDHRSDIFSLGVVLYELATRTHPFLGSDVGDTMTAILRDIPRRADAVRPEVPPELAELLERCIEKDTDRRLQGASELRDELDALARGPANTGQVLHETPIARRWPLLVAAGVGLASVLTVAALLSGLYASSDVRPTTEAVTTSQYYEGGPNWSPASEYVAFGRMVDGSSDIYLKPMGGGKAVAKTKGPGDEVAPRWSPDRTHLAYVTTGEPGVPVMVISPHAEGPQDDRARRVAGTNMPPFDIRTHLATLGDHPWSLDGTTLLVSRVGANDRAAIWRVPRVPGTPAVQLTEPPVDCDDLGASYSADRKRIVFWRRRHGLGALMSMDANGGKMRTILPDDDGNRAPSWRADGRRVIFESNRGHGPTWQIWELDTKTDDLRQLTFDTHFSSNGVSVSKDDEVIYVPFWHDTSLTVLDVGTRESERLTEWSGDNFGPRFSPDDTAIAYFSSRSGNPEIYVHPLDGSEEYAIASDPAADLYPDWSNDGDHIIFVSNRDGLPRVYIADAASGGNCRVLVDRAVCQGFAPGRNSLSIRWSPDGKAIGYIVDEDEHKTLWAIAPDGTNERKILGDVQSFDWYLDSTRVVCTVKRAGGLELIALDIETREQSPLWQGAHTEINVSPDGDWICMCVGMGHLSMSLARLKLELPTDGTRLPSARGEPAILVPAQGNSHVHAGGWSSDGLRLVYVHDQDRSNLYRVIEPR